MADPVLSERVAYRFRGPAALAGTSALVVMVTAARLSSGGDPAPLLGALAGLVFVLVALTAAYRVLGDTPDGAAPAGRRRTPRPAAGLLGRGPGHPLTVRRLRLRTMTGEVVACLMYGETRGDEIRHGDTVRITGRRTRDGHCVARRAEILTAPAGPVVCRVVPRRPLAFLAASWLNRLCLGVAALALLWAVLVAVNLP